MQHLKNCEIETKCMIERDRERESEKKIIKKINKNCFKIQGIHRFIENIL